MAALLAQCNVLLLCRIARCRHVSSFRTSAKFVQMRIMLLLHLVQICLCLAQMTFQVLLEYNEAKPRQTLTSFQAVDIK